MDEAGKNATDNSNKNAIHFAAKARRRDVIEMLADAEIDVDQ